MNNQANEKILVRLVNSVTKEQLFFATWGVIAFGFAWAMYKFYKRQHQSNFRRDSAPQTKSEAVVPAPRSDVSKK